jgi:hypothetical protein
MGERLKPIGLFGARPLLQPVAVNDRDEVGKATVAGRHRQNSSFYAIKSKNCKAHTIN